MQSAADREREDQVLEQCISALSDHSRGVSVTLIANPDRLQPHERTLLGIPVDLTVDGLLLVTLDGHEEQWALDVMTLSWNHRLTPATKTFEKILRPGLEELAEKHRVLLDVECWPLATTRGELKRLQREIMTEVDADLAARRTICIRNGWNLQVRTNRRTPEQNGEGGAWVVITPLLGSDPRSIAELEKSIGEPLKGKLTRQIACAKDLGYRTIIALDALGSSKLSFGANDAVPRETVTAFLGESVSRAAETTGQRVLDLGLHVGKNGAIPIYGKRP